VLDTGGRLLGENKDIRARNSDSQHILQQTNRGKWPPSPFQRTCSVRMFITLLASVRTGLLTTSINQNVGIAEQIQPGYLFV
jgi:hypothetical protein